MSVVHSIRFLSYNRDGWLGKLKVAPLHFPKTGTHSCSDASDFTCPLRAALKSCAPCLEPARSASECGSEESVVNLPRCYAEIALASGTPRATDSYFYADVRARENIASSISSLLRLPTTHARGTPSPPILLLNGGNLFCRPVTPAPSASGDLISKEALMPRRRLSALSPI